MPSERKFPYVSYKFLVEIEGIVEARFSECSGLQVETEFEERQEGGVNEYRHKLPKGSKYANLTLKRGLTDSPVLWNWHRDVVNGKVQRKSVSVIVWDVWDVQINDQRWRWDFKDAYPVKWTGPELKWDSNTVAIETLELAHHGISSVTVKKT
jgi:phage tail-like protein